MWQQNQASDVDDQHPFIMCVCLSPEMPVIVQAVLGLEQEPVGLDTVAGIRPTNLALAINGDDLTSRCGPFPAGIIDLDIAKHLRPTGWNEIAVQSSRPGRIEACLFVHVASESESLT